MRFFGDKQGAKPGDATLVNQLPPMVKGRRRRRAHLARYL